MELKTIEDRFKDHLILERESIKAIIINCKHFYEACANNKELLLSFLLGQPVNCSLPMNDGKFVKNLEELHQQFCGKWQQWLENSGAITQMNQLKLPSHDDMSNGLEYFRALTSAPGTIIY